MASKQGHPNSRRKATTRESRPYSALAPCKGASHPLRMSQSLVKNPLILKLTDGNLLFAAPPVFDASRVSSRTNTHALEINVTPKIVKAVCGPGCTLTLLLGAILISVSPLRLAAQSADDILSSLRRTDASEMLLNQPTQAHGLFGFAATYVAHLKYGQGRQERRETLECEAVWTNGFCMMSISSRYDGDPSYASGRILGRSTNACVTRTVWRGVLYSPQQNVERDELLTYTIRPDGGIVSTNPQNTLFTYEVGDSTKLMFFNQFRLATGRCFSMYLERATVEPEAVRPGEALTLTASGWFGWLAGKGTWAITCDTDAVWLVREANFTRQGAPAPKLLVVTAGTVSCPGLSVAASGTWQENGITQSDYQVLSLTNLSSPEQFNARYADLSKRINAPLPPGVSQSIDWSGPVPKSIRQ